MEPAPPIGKLDYETPGVIERRSAGWLWLAAVVALLVATAAGDETLDAFRHREWTQAHTQYWVTETWRQHNNPGYVVKPFPGRLYKVNSPFQLPSFYVCAAAGTVGVVAIWSARRRQRQPGNAG